MERRLWALLAAPLLLAGCASPTPGAEPAAATDPADVGAGVPWNLTAQRDLGFFARAQLPFASVTPPMSDAYCKELSLSIPPGSAALLLTFVAETVDAADGGVGALGFGARSESAKQWVDNPRGSILDPAGTAASAANWTQPVKTISIPAPEPGRWSVYAFTNGLAYHATGNLTIEIEGASREAPRELPITMTCP